MTVALAATVWSVWHRSSRAVRLWRRPAGRRVGAGPLSVRVLGDGDGRESVVLLHGLVATGDYFGRRFDVLGGRGRVVVPDLAGFGDSLRADVVDFGLSGHCDALDAMASALDLFAQPVVVAGHSMGSVLAAFWAARHPTNVRAVVVFNPPLQRSPAQLRQTIVHMGIFERFLVFDTDAARRLCAWTCRHRMLAGWLSAIGNPTLPVPIARAGSQHTWASYLGALDGIVLHDDLESAVRILDSAGIPLRMCLGSNDVVSDPILARELSARYPRCEVRMLEGGHHLPLNMPDECVAAFDLRRP